MKFTALAAGELNMPLPFRNLDEVVVRPSRVRGSLSQLQRRRKLLNFECLEERRVLATSIFQEAVDHGFGIYTGGKDIELRQASPTTPRPAGTGGANPLLSVDFTDPAPATNSTHVLLRFDNIFGAGPGQIPWGATILSASLQVTTGDAGDGAKFHRALTPWDEVTSTWDSMVDGL